MKIGIDISQMAFSGTGVGNYVEQLVLSLLQTDTTNEYVLFFSSMRRNVDSTIDRIKKLNSTVQIKTYKFPPVVLNLLWNTLHIVPIEHFIGDVDIFISSDWTQPPVKKAKNVTILYDVIVYTYPEETAEGIVTTQKKRLAWVKKECDAILCISESTKKDAMSILGIPEEKLHVVYPGVS